MTWWVKWGPQFDRLKAIEEQTGIVPTALASAPVIPGHLREMVDAFLLLSSRRSVGMAANPIPLVEIHGYLTLFGEPVLGTDGFVKLIVHMDNLFLEQVKPK